MISCPACGLQLPEFARYCARCGRRLPLLRGDAPPLWVLILFWLGTAVALAVALAYTLILFIPGLLAENIDPGQLRALAGVVVAIAGLMFIAQFVTSLGLTLGKSWAKAMATLICVVWALTCFGLPLSVLALSAIWRPLKPPEPATAPPP